jgi:hypothetical protein
MPGDADSIRLDVCFDGGSPTGRATADGGTTRRFAGWLGLMAAVEALVDQPALPAAGQARASEQEESTDE